MDDEAIALIQSLLAQVDAITSHRTRIDAAARITAAILTNPNVKTIDQAVARHAAQCAVDAVHTIETELEPRAGEGA